MEFRILGPLEVLDGKQPVPLKGAKPRALLAVLLLHANEVVSNARLVDELWGERPPATAERLVQGYVHALRKELGADVLVTQAPGYRLRVEPGALDLLEFQRLVAEARAAEPEEAARATPAGAVALARPTARGRHLRRPRPARERPAERAAAGNPDRADRRGARAWAATPR